ncbi:MAG: 3',5'-cyclic-nucleotide phosphodiesterase [Hydrogenophilales bacterium]|nr:3',5'-cyclic-nucleotide phosphodiesterase [Hydrogenophilales bacterium]
MRVRVLGCSGGIGGGRHTTSMLVDDDCLIDAGSGVMRLGLEELVRIDHVFVTHSHLDHILALPLLLDSVSSLRDGPITLHATPETLAILRGHLFNWLIWPDFSRIPNPDHPFLIYRTLSVGEPIYLGGREITAIPASHTVPAVGYRLRGPRASLIFSGDTESHPALWEYAANSADLGDLIVEASFTNDLAELAHLSKHYCPQTLAPDLVGLAAATRIWVSHLKPGQEEAILAEINATGFGHPPARALYEDQIFEL